MPRVRQTRLSFVSVFAQRLEAWAVWLGIVLSVVGPWSTPPRPPLEVPPVGPPLEVVQWVLPWAE